MKNIVPCLMLLSALYAAAAGAQENPSPSLSLRLQTIYASYNKDAAGYCRQLEEILQSPEASSLSTREAKAAYHFLGNCSYQQKNHDKAYAAYLKAADFDVADPQPLIDAGSVYVEQGLYAEAEAKYREALQRVAGDEKQEKRIRNIIRHIPNKLQSKFTVATSVGHDSNVNSGPEGAIHLLYGVYNYTLDSDDRPRDDFYSSNSASVALTKALNPNTYLLLNASASATTYFEENNYNTNLLSLSPGLKKIFNGKSITVSPFVNYQTYDGTSYQTTGGLNIAGAMKVSDKINVWPSVSGYAQNFYDDEPQDALGMFMGSSASYQLNPKTSWISSLFYSFNNADHNLYTYHSIFIGNSLRRTLLTNLTGSLGYNFQFFDYDELDPAFGSVREDRGHTVFAGLDYSLKDILKTADAWLNLNVSRNETDSNQSFYDNRRIFTALKFMFSF